MKTRSLYLIGAAVAVMSILYACKKDSNNNNNSGQSAADLQTQSDDQTQVSNETDAVVDDVNVMLGSQAAVSGSSSDPGVKYQVVTNDAKPIGNAGICDASATLDSSAGSYHLTITYNGTNCAGNRKRTGTVVVSWAAGTHWRDKNAVVNVSIQNLKITRVWDNKSITLNGTHTYTNVSGGSLLDLALGKIESVTHTVTSDDMSITFDNGAKRTWHVARQRVYTVVNQNAVITTTGLHTDGNNTGISEWGTNRWGNDFVTQITQALVIDQACSWRLTQGEVKIIRPAVTTTITFGLDANGSPTGCPGDGTYYFKLVWQAEKTYTFILPY
ncbi:MAG TPA: hypothetical protein VHC48_14225 [Puia sp.]|nr:hypothetical protein [Puia sp.]